MERRRHGHTYNTRFASAKVAEIERQVARAPVSSVFILSIKCYGFTPSYGTTPLHGKKGVVPATSGALKIVTRHDLGSAMPLPGALDTNKDDCTCFGIIGGHGSPQAASKEVCEISAQTRQASPPVQFSEQQGSDFGYWVSQTAAIHMD